MKAKLVTRNFLNSIFRFSDPPKVAPANELVERDSTLSCAVKLLMYTTLCLSLLIILLIIAGAGAGAETLDESEAGALL